MIVREVSVSSLCVLDRFTCQLCLENLRYIEYVTRNRKELWEVVLAAIVFLVHSLFMFCLRWPIQHVSL